MKYSFKRLLSLVSLVLTLALTVGLSTFTMHAEAAKRIGSGKSMGTQRQATSDKAPTAAAAAPSRSWMGPIAGIAAGLGLAALASHLGFGPDPHVVSGSGLLEAGGTVRRKAHTTYDGRDR